MTHKEAMIILEELMIENKDVLIRLKEGKDEDYTIEKIKENKNDSCYKNS